jgi:hypothetical protein
MPNDIFEQIIPGIPLAVHGTACSHGKQGEQLATDLHCVPKGCWNRWKLLIFMIHKAMIEPVPK